MNQNLRQLKIDLITGDYNPIIEWFEGLWFNINSIHIDIFHIHGGEILYYIIEDDSIKSIFYRDDINNDFYCDDDRFWLIMKTCFNIITYNEIESISRILLEHKLDSSIFPSKYKLSQNVILNDMVRRKYEEINYVNRIETVE